MKYNFPLFRQRCELPLESFAHLGRLTTAPNGRHIFIERGAQILAVAHMDSVSAPSHFAVDEATGIVFAPTLDDRLGAHIILDILPTMGVCADILLTENEEACHSTAADFTLPPGKRYNWVFSFDRAGSDVVTYRYDSRGWKKSLRRAGWKIGMGSYSCIAELDQLGVCAANFGAAYHDHHTPGAYCSLHELGANLVRFCAFYAQNKDKKFTYKSRADSYRQLCRYDYSRDNELQYDPQYPCTWCGMVYGRDELERDCTGYVCVNCAVDLKNLKYHPS